MTMAQRILAFAMLLGFDIPLFDNVGDANAFIQLAEENPVLKSTPLYLEWVGPTHCRKVSVSADAHNNDTASSSTTLNWGCLTRYLVDRTGIVNNV